MVMETGFEESFQFEIDDVTSSVLGGGIIPGAIREYYEVVKVGTRRGKTIVDESHGSFAVAYKMNALQPGNNNLCFRVWYNTALIGDACSRLEDEQARKEEIDRAEQFSERLKGIASPLFTWKDKLPYFSNFEFVREAIKVTNSKGCVRSIPGMRMDWIEGTPLGEYIRQHADDTGKMKALAEAFMTMCKQFREYGVSHGDLSCNNILVCEKDNVEIKLVDYDSIYIEQTMADMHCKQALAGTPGFQHPQRLNANEPIPASVNDDNFSQQVIYLSILAVALNPKIAESYDALLLFSDDDLNDAASFRKSEGYKEVTDLNSKEASFFLNELERAISGPLDSVKSICDLDQELNNSQDTVPPPPKPWWKKLSEWRAIAGIKPWWKNPFVWIAIAAIVFLGGREISAYLANSQQSEQAREIIVPALESQAWRVTMLNGEQMRLGDTGATLTAQNANGTAYKIEIYCTSMAIKFETSITVDRYTGIISSPELGEGRVEVKEDNFGKQLKLIFNGCIVEK